MKKAKIHWRKGHKPTLAEKAHAKQVAKELGEINWDSFNREVQKRMPPRPPGIRRHHYEPRRVSPVKATA